MSVGLANLESFFFVRGEFKHCWFQVEEFNVSISQFVSNIKGDRDKASDIILNNELLLMQQLNYNLTVHNPYRPVEGLMIDIKVSKSLWTPKRICTFSASFLFPLKACVTRV